MMQLLDTIISQPLVTVNHSSDWPENGCDLFCSATTYPFESSSSTRLGVKSFTLQLISQMLRDALTFWWAKINPMATGQPRRVFREGKDGGG